MLVNFRVENYKSFKDVTEFSMEATALKNLTKSNIFPANTMSLLKSAVIYGANASGKSNFLKAMSKMKQIIDNSVDMQRMKHYTHEPYFLNSETEKNPTTFEVEFILDEILNRYGFTISYEGVIESEWLYQKKLQSRARDTKLFEREKSDISVGVAFKEGKGLEGKTRENALFLSIVAQFNGEISKKIIDWFFLFTIHSSIKSEQFKYLSHYFLNEDEYKEKITDFIKSADVGIYDLVTEKVSLIEFLMATNDHNVPPEMMAKMIDSMGINAETKDEPILIKTLHIQYDAENRFKEFKKFDLSFESDGTQRLLALAAPLLYALSNGTVVIIDELDNSLHTDLVKATIKLFNSKKTNPNNAQLIFTTHDTNLLDQEMFRRDQIWFTQKDIYGASELYSLVEYGKGKTRDDMALEKNYLAGKFGGKPHITELEYQVD